MTDATTAPADAAAAPAKKGKSKLFLIVGLVVVLLAGGGGAYFAFAGKHEKPAEVGKDGKAKKEEEHKAPATYVKLDPPFVVNFDAKGVTRFLQVSIEIMTRDPAVSELLKQHDPRIRNDLLLMLGNQTQETISSRDGKEKLRTDALQIVADIIKSEGGDPKKVEQLYFTSFVMQ